MWIQFYLHVRWICIEYSYTGKNKKQTIVYFLMVKTEKNSYFSVSPLDVRLLWCSTFYSTHCWCRGGEWEGNFFCCCCCLPNLSYKNLFWWIWFHIFTGQCIKHIVHFCNFTLLSGSSQLHFPLNVDTVLRGVTQKKCLMWQNNTSPLIMVANQKYLNPFLVNKRLVTLI